jgi:hypothetical protein
MPGSGGVSPQGVHMRVTKVTGAGLMSETSIVSPKFLLRVHGKKQNTYAAHIWLETANDTACTLWSTGGIRSFSKYEVKSHAAGRRICHMCETSYKNLAMLPLIKAARGE